MLSRQLIARMVSWTCDWDYVTSTRHGIYVVDDTADNGAGLYHLDCLRARLDTSIIPGAEIPLSFRSWTSTNFGSPYVG